MLDRLLSQLQSLGVRLSIDGAELKVMAPPGSLTGELIKELKERRDELLAMLKHLGSTAAEDVHLTRDEPGRHQPFPLTELQHAYWLGRDVRIEMGGIASHFYLELDCQDLDVVRAQEALNRLISEQDMLRCVLNGDGTQKVLKDVPPYHIRVIDALAHPSQTPSQLAEQTRDLLSHQVLDPTVWPIFDIRATLLSKDVTRLHISLDLLLFDAWSLSLFFSAWHGHYAGAAAAKPLEVGYRDYVLKEIALRDSAAYQSAKAYWDERVPTIPPAPELPLRVDPLARRGAHYTRHAHRLEASKWSRIKDRAREKGLTPSAVLLAAYSEVLARWSAEPHFTVAVTTGRREPWHADVQRIIGDFTSVVLNEVDRRDQSASFEQFAAGVQRQLMRDLDHGACSGVAVRREWARLQQRPLDAVMPVVFSSALAREGGQEVGDHEQFGQRAYCITQTSQVWLDHHVAEQRGDLLINWDAAEAVFEPGVIDAMFCAYVQLVEWLAQEASDWSRQDVVKLPDSMLARREPMAPLCPAQPLEPLHTGFVRHALKRPDDVAVLSGTRALSYGDLLAQACAICDWLWQRDVKPGQLVAIAMHKGSAQMAAVMGVLLAGAAYVPVDPALPVKRQRELMDIAGVAHIVTEPSVLRPEVLEGPWVALAFHSDMRSTYGPHHASALQATELDRIAYTIFTSGTTGVPKGVVIDHKGASNTVLAMNAMIGLDRSDRVMAVSSLSFDLSVYDIFGALGVGAALVLPNTEQGHDPGDWMRLMAMHGVTVWNSAPQLMQMLLDACEMSAGASLSCLRTVMLSGDFIPTDLPRRLRSCACDGQIISLGGATEASIWSIYHLIEPQDCDLPSIPYGKALPNQRVTVLDKSLRFAPDYVRGRIHISGMGLAKGYLHDEERTARQFRTHPICHERLYDTGDIGLCDKHGRVIILGRDDGQVKIRGHRVELGEIESVLRRHPAVAQAVVVANAAGGHKRLVAYVQPRSNLDSPDVDAYKAFVHEHLPDYMVPRHIVLLAQLPVSPNGKVDYRALPDVGMLLGEDDELRVRPRTPGEEQVLKVWQEVMPGLDIGVTDNFFELGGDSVLATRLIHALNARLDAHLEMHNLFENLTVEELARFIEVQGHQSEAPTQGTVSCEELTDDLDEWVQAVAAVLDKPPLPDAGEGCCLLTGATGWVGGFLLAELLGRTQQRVICLVRGESAMQARDRLASHLASLGLTLSTSQWARLEVLPGDLTQAHCGLDSDQWARLCQSVSSIYHLAGAVTLAQGYRTLRNLNVAPLLTLLELAHTESRKRMAVLSPMTVCRRRGAEGMEVLVEESPHTSAEGLLTGYAQSKWVVEQVLDAAASRGAKVTVYRCSHALPSSDGKQLKAHDTYTAVFAAALMAGRYPDWLDAHVFGMPVDILCQCLVQDHQEQVQARPLVVHLENPKPIAFSEAIKRMLDKSQGAERDGALAYLAWKDLCLQRAGELPDGMSQLAHRLFDLDDNLNSAIDHMFTGSRFMTAYGQARPWSGLLVAAADPSYWSRIGAALTSQEWSQEHHDASN